MTCSSTNWWTISVMAFCSSVFSAYGLVATATLGTSSSSLTRESILVRLSRQRVDQELGAHDLQGIHRNVGHDAGAADAHDGGLGKSRLGDRLPRRQVVLADLGD